MTRQETQNISSQFWSTSRPSIGPCPGQIAACSAALPRHQACTCLRLRTACLWGGPRLTARQQLMRCWPQNGEDDLDADMAAVEAQATPDQQHFARFAARVARAPEQVDSFKEPSPCTWALLTSNDLPTIRAGSSRALALRVDLKIATVVWLSKRISALVCHPPPSPAVCSCRCSGTAFTKVLSLCGPAPAAS